MDSSDEVSEQFAHSLASSLIIAAYLNWALLGILCTQTLAYYLAFPRDRPLAKILVYGVLLLEMTQTALVSHDVFVALASPWGGASLAKLNSIQNHWFSISVSGGISGGIGQLFFAYRIWFISSENSRGAPIIISILATASAVSALVSAESFFRAKTFSYLLNGNSGFAAIGTWNGIGAICDIVIALVMPYFLMRHGTGMPPTHIMIVKIVRLILETGTFNAVVAILHMCLYFANSQAFVVPGLALSKVYANILLLLFNNRIKVVDGRGNANDSSNSNWEAAFREDINRNNEQPPSPITRKSVTREAGPGRARSTSTVIVSNNRLIFRLADMPPSPQRANPTEQPSSPVERTRQSLEKDMTSSVGTRSDISLHMPLEPNLSYPHPSMDSKV